MYTRLYALPVVLVLPLLLTGCTPPPDSVNQNATAPTDSSPAEPPVTDSTEPPKNANVDESKSREARPTVPGNRNFKFHYAGVITELKAGSTARIWLPEATSSDVQKVRRVEIDLPGKHEETTDKEFGNRLIYFEAVANEQGEIPFSVTYEVERSEVIASNAHEALETDKFLRPNSLVPTDKELLDAVFENTNKPEGETLAIARQLYDKIGDRMKYDKPEGGDWGRGDAVWACDSRYGNCTDFHSLFIALCRESEIPSYFEIGFAISPDDKSGDVGGYHCWAMFANGKKWIPVDISEADKHPEMNEYYFGNLTPDRVTFTRGRDLVLQPASQTESVNFLVYPHIEVDGKVHKSFQKAFRFEEL